MQVRNILKLKGDAGVVTVQPDATLMAAAGILAERGIGSVVVSHDGARAEGILSERDIVRQIAVRGPDCLSERVGTCMTARVVTCALDDSADDVLGKMTEGRFRHMPVLQEGRMVGIVTIGDVVKARLTELSMEKDALQGMIMGY
ncbi:MULTISPECIES: CBS domain-containing protein [unclassified Rhodosalinus]|uniref:CBS domain-containing protein n=1 Tax=unclassified Rhodosalinus TaxID=2630183 RepID=UPI0035232BD4